MKKMNKKGFTLIEMLVVIAIIAVLVAIVIPTVGSATEKAKEAADVANIRSAIAEVTTNALAGGTVLSKDVTMTQGTANFVNSDIKTIGGLSSNQFDAVKGATKDTVVTISADAATAKISVKIGATTYTQPTEAAG